MLLHYYIFSFYHFNNSSIYLDNIVNIMNTIFKIDCVAQIKGGTL